MQIRDVMTPQVEIIDPEATMAAAAAAMRDGDFGMLPVAESDKMIGAITDRDIAVRGVAEGLDPKTAMVRDLMTKGIDWCFDDQDAHEVARMMSRKQIRRLPVVNHDKRLVGIVSLGDLAVERETAGPAEAALSEVSSPAHH